MAASVRRDPRLGARGLTFVTPSSDRCTRRPRRHQRTTCHAVHRTTSGTEPDVHNSVDTQELSGLLQLLECVPQHRNCPVRQLVVGEALLMEGECAIDRGDSALVEEELDVDLVASSSAGPHLLGQQRPFVGDDHLDGSHREHGTLVGFLERRELDLHGIMEPVRSQSPTFGDLLRLQIGPAAPATGGVSAQVPSTVQIDYSVDYYFSLH